MIYLQENFLSVEECESLMTSATTHAGLVDSPRGGTAGLSSVRSSRVAFLFDDKITEKLWVGLSRANRIFQFDINLLEPPQLSEYREKDYYGWHQDVGDGQAKRRKLSASIQLSDPNSYEGGNLEIWGSTDPVERAQGTMIVFPSFLMHRVCPVVSGIRRSLVVWALGNEAFK